MIEAQIQLLHETVSNLAKKFEEERISLELAGAAKDAELTSFARELENTSGQLREKENQVRFLEEQLNVEKQRAAALEAEASGLRAELDEVRKNQSQEISQARELIEAQIRGLDQKFTDERVKWREALRSN